MYTESLKRAIYNYREKNKEEYNRYMLELNMKRYVNNKEEMNKRRNELSYWRKQNDYDYMAKTFRKILL